MVYFFGFAIIITIEATKTFKLYLGNLLMKKLALTALTALTLTASATSFASVTNEEASYLFGTQEAIEMQVISATEMQATEGQLFGITFELIGGYIDKAIVIVKPILAPAKPYLGSAFTAVKDAALKALATRFSAILGGL